MNTFTVSATELKNTISDVLNTVYYNKIIANVERHGKLVARITPVIDDKKQEIDRKALIKKYFGIIPDFPDAKTIRASRFFRKRNIKL